VLTQSCPFQKHDVHENHFKNLLLDMFVILLQPQPSYISNEDKVFRFFLLLTLKQKIEPTLISPEINHIFIVVTFSDWFQQIFNITSSIRSLLMHFSHINCSLFRILQPTKLLFRNCEIFLVWLFFFLSSAELL